MCGLRPPIRRRRYQVQTSTRRNAAKARPGLRAKHEKPSLVRPVSASRARAGKRTGGWLRAVPRGPQPAERRHDQVGVARCRRCGSTAPGGSDAMRGRARADRAARLRALARGPPRANAAWPHRGESHPPALPAPRGQEERSNSGDSSQHRIGCVPATRWKPGLGEQPRAAPHSSDVRRGVTHPRRPKDCEGQRARFLLAGGSLGNRPRAVTLPSPRTGERTAPPSADSHRKAQPDRVHPPRPRGPTGLRLRRERGARREPAGGWTRPLSAIEPNAARGGRPGAAIVARSAAPAGSCAAARGELGTARRNPEHAAPGPAAAGVLVTRRRP